MLLLQLNKIGSGTRTGVDFTLDGAHICTLHTTTIDSYSDVTVTIVPGIEELYITDEQQDKPISCRVNLIVGETLDDAKNIGGLTIETDGGLIAKIWVYQPQFKDGGVMYSNKYVRLALECPREVGVWRLGMKSRQ